MRPALSATQLGKGVVIRVGLPEWYAKLGERWHFAERRIKFRYVLPFGELERLYGDPLRVRWPGTQPGPADVPDQVDTYIRTRR